MNSGFSASFAVPSRHRKTKTVEAEVASGGSAASCIVSAVGLLTAPFVPRSLSFTPMCARAEMAARKQGSEWPLCAFLRNRRSTPRCAFVDAVALLIYLFFFNDAGGGWSHAAGPLQVQNEAPFRWGTSRPEMRPIRILCAVNFTGRRWSGGVQTIDS